MSKAASKTLIGGFVLGATALLVAGILIFGSGRFFKDSETYVLYFRGSVKGLSVGAPVSFKGVQIGSVNNIKLRVEGENLELRIPVYIQTETDKFTIPEDDPGLQKILANTEPEEVLHILIKRGLRAQLQLQSLVTGLLMIELDFFPDSSAKMIEPHGPYMEIPTIPSDMEELTKKIRKLPIEELATQIQDLIGGLERLVNSPELKQSFKSLGKLLNNADTLVLNINDQIKPLSSAVEETIRDTQRLVKDVNAQVGPLASGVDDTLKDTQKLVKNIDGMVTPLKASINKTAESAHDVLVQANQTLRKFENVVSDDSAVMHEITNALRELAAAARAIRTWADYLERHPEALIRGKR